MFKDIKEKVKSVRADLVTSIVILDIYEIKSIFIDNAARNMAELDLMIAQVEHLTKED
jgi:phenylalanyl-tRNA synthetase beta subunit